MHQSFVVPTGISLTGVYASLYTHNLLCLLIRVKLVGAMEGHGHLTGLR